MLDFILNGDGYEVLNLRAHKKMHSSQLKQSQGRHTYRNMVDASNGKILFKQMGSFEKQFDNVKKEVGISIEKLSKAYKSQKEISDVLEALKLKLSTINCNVDELGVLIKKALDVTPRE